MDVEIHQYRGKPRAFTTTRSCRLEVTLHFLSCKRSRNQTMMWNGHLKRMIAICFFSSTVKTNALMPSFRYVIKSKLSSSPAHQQKDRVWIFFKFPTEYYNRPAPVEGIKKAAKLAENIDLKFHTFAPLHDAACFDTAPSIARKLTQGDIVIRYEGAVLAVKAHIVMLVSSSGQILKPATVEECIRHAIGPSCKFKAFGQRDASTCVFAIDDYIIPEVFKSLKMVRVGGFDCNVWIEVDGRTIE